MTLSLCPLEKNDIGLGAIGSAVSLSAGYVAMESSAHLIKKFGVILNEPQTFFRFYESLSKISHGLLRGIAKSVAVVYVILLVPILEEFFFRDLIYKWQEDHALAGEKCAAKVYRVLSNGIIFGAIHFSFFQGWANVPILAVTMVAGIVFAALRELTGNTRASTVAHCMNNSFFMLMKYLKV